MSALDLMESVLTNYHIPSALHVSLLHACLFYVCSTPGSGTFVCTSPSLIITFSKCSTFLQIFHDTCITFHLQSS